jgi:hypothetical protein
MLHFRHYLTVLMKFRIRVLTKYVRKILQWSLLYIKFRWIFVNCLKNALCATCYRIVNVYVIMIYSFYIQYFLDVLNV